MTDAGVHVFVDPSGRRGRLLHRLTVTAGFLLALAVVLLVVALIAPPSLTRVLVPGLSRQLPGAAAPPLQSGPRGVVGSLQTVLATPAPSASATVGATPTAAPQATGVPTVRPTGRPTPTPVPTPASTPTANRPPTPPGQASRTPAPGRPTAKPTPRGTPRGGKPTASPTP